MMHLNLRLLTMVSLLSVSANTHVLAATIVPAGSATTATATAPKTLTATSASSDALKAKIKEKLKVEAKKSVIKVVERKIAKEKAKLEAPKAATPVKTAIVAPSKIAKPATKPTAQPASKSVEFIATNPSAKKVAVSTPTSGKFFVQLGSSLCDAALPLPRDGGRTTFDAKGLNRACMTDFLKNSFKNDFTKGDLFGAALRICSGHSENDVTRKYSCFLKAQAMLPYEGSMQELKLCGLAKTYSKSGKLIVPSKSKQASIASCVEDQLQCSAQFPELKDGVRERLARVEKLKKTLKVTTDDATERWGVLSTSEVTAGNAEAARLCLLKTKNAYSQLRRPTVTQASVDGSVELILKELTMTFPDSAPQSESNAYLQENGFHVVQ